MTEHAPLEGFTVVGLEHSVAGPLCTRVLADLGARAIKVERAPHGDFARHWDGNVAGEGAQFWWLNRGKESIVLDLKQERDRRTFDALLDHADAFVYNISPGASERLGLTEATLRARFPHLINCHISGYGDTGTCKDRKAYDMLIQAEAGIMSLTGSPAQPSRAGVSISDVGTGLYAATLVVAGLLGRTRHGTGHHLDVAMFDATLEFAAPMLLSFLNAGTIYPRIPNKHHAIAPYGVFSCADGSQLLIAIEHDTEWERFAREILNRPDLADDPRFASNTDRLANREIVDELVANAIGKLDGESAQLAIAGLELAYASLNDMRDVSNHPVLGEREMIDTTATQSGAPAHALIGLGKRLYWTRGAKRERPPALGEDTDFILKELDRPERAHGS